MACGALSCFISQYSLHFAIRTPRRSSSSSPVSLHASTGSGRLIRPVCRALGSSESDAVKEQAGITIVAAEEYNCFVKPLSNVYSVVPCRFCHGSGDVKCEVCEGQGSLARGGFHKRNPVPMARIVGSNWTAMERTFGKHHFYVHSKRRGSGKKDWFVEMVSACDETTRFWINAKILKDRERWSAGWLQRGELEGIQGPREEKQEAKANTTCKACKGCGMQPCPMCAKLEEGKIITRKLDIIEV